MSEKLTKDSYPNAIKEGVCLVIAGAHWCPDCRKIEPIIEKLAQEYGQKVKFFTVATDAEESLKDSLNIRRIPTLIFYKNGAEVGERLVEPNSKPLIENAIKSALDS